MEALLLPCFLGQDTEQSHSENLQTGGNHYLKVLETLWFLEALSQWKRLAVLSEDVC